jgi:hypothetical protein
MVVGFTTICAISAYRHWSCEFEPCSWQGVLDKTLCDKVFQWLATSQWFFPGTPVSSTNKTNRHDITEILLKVTLNSIKTLILSIVTHISRCFIFTCPHVHLNGPCLVEIISSFCFDVRYVKLEKMFISLMMRWIKWKAKNTALLEQFQNPIEKS